MSTATTPGLHYLQLTELSELLRSRTVSPVEVTRAQLDRIAALDGKLASYVMVMADQALAAAERAGREIAAGQHRGVLHGVPVAIKDLFWTKDAPAAAGMAVYRDFRPGQDATAVARLRDAGAIILGKLQMTEGAYSDHHPSITPPVNPWDAGYWTGISSSGPAVATAAGLCYGSLASDTGGSIRWPCAATGLTGIKPTWGRVSRHGTFALAPSMDHAGPIARSAADATALLTVLSGPDPADPTSLPGPAPDLNTGGIRPLRAADRRRSPLERRRCPPRCAGSSITGSRDVPRPRRPHHRAHSPRRQPGGRGLGSPVRGRSRRRPRRYLPRPEERVRAGTGISPGRPAAPSPASNTRKSCCGA